MKMNLKIGNLTKKYKRNKYGLKDFSLELENGITGLLGPNGAGKSTLMRIIATVTRATEGTVLWNGTDIGKKPNAVRKELGYLPQDFGVYPNLNAVEFLEYIAAVKGLSGKKARMRIDALLEEVNLGDVKKQKIGTYSGGMKQRIGIAQVLLNDPGIMIFDEPTVGLDPEERVRFRNLLSHLSGDRIVILSSHIVSDVESIADNIAIMNGGKLLTHSLPHRILDTMAGKVYEKQVSDDQFKAFSTAHIISNSLRRAEGRQVRYISGDPRGTSGTPVKPTLEDAYLWYTKNGHSDTPNHGETHA